MRLDKVNGNWLLNLVKKHGLEGAAELQNYDMQSLASAIEDIQHMQYHKQPFYEEFFYVLKKPSSIIKETPEKVGSMIQEYGATRTASLLQVSYTTLRRYLDIHGLSSKPKSLSVDIEELRQHLSEGKSVFEFAKSHRLHPNTIYQYMRANGLDSPQKRSKLTREALKAYLDQGLSAQEIATKENIHVQTVYQRLRAEGLQTPTAHRPDHTQLLNAIADLLSAQPDPEKAYRVLYRPAFKKELQELISIL